MFQESFGTRSRGRKLVLYVDSKVVIELPLLPISEDTCVPPFSRPSSFTLYY